MTEEWWEIEVKGDPNSEDLVFWELQSAGCLGTAAFKRDGNPVVCGYLPASQVQEADISSIAQQLKDAIAIANFTPAQISWSKVLQEDWANS